jgi:hypothetical protein
VPRGHFSGLRIALYLFFAWGCGGNLAVNGGADASSTSDASSAMVDASSDSPDVDASSDSPDLDGPSVDGSGDAGADMYSGPCTISASNYDQACNVDSDCAEVSSGDYCSATICRCGGSVVNVGALAQFNADVSKTPLGSGALMGATCGCAVPGGPCCRQGMCQNGYGNCSAPADTLPACADAGGMCMPSVLYYGGCAQGPPGSCAYADEVCCLP